MNTEFTAVYPGSFDPPTNGHLDIITRASGLFPKIVVAVTENQNKNHLFTLSERVSLLKESSKMLTNVEVVPFSGLLAHFLEKLNSFTVIRGLRALSDFEYEFQMALMNRKLNKKIETVFLMPDQAYTFLSSSMVKEIASLGGKTSKLVPACVERKLKEISKCMI
ncbi:MAG: pantetheine-phosphate adenylyltransferase [Endomicrobium sp.]|jgi:pantetheine-phosphate adenylyltransferase|nr:pantetheine-phosphate adenylyltransferase [Endomicrobium sp.]